jgi:sec-independent protein translocase protein TatC
MKALRPIGHEERLSIVDHLDELRSRLFACGAIMVVIFAVCFWQNTHLINALNRALPPAATTGLGSQQHLNATLGQTLKHASGDMAKLSTSLSKSKGIAPGAVSATQNLSSDLLQASKEFPKAAKQQAKPITIGVGESFTTTLTVVGYFTLLLSLPMILYQLYAFVVPALSRDERRIATPTMIAAPLLFVAGAAFTYFEVLPPAIHFLQGYNAEQFQILIQARTYYRFEILLMLGIGFAFQVPLLLLGLQKVGVITSRTLTVNWRYAVVLIAVVAAALPGVDPVTLTLETIPLLLLFVASIVLLKIVEHRTAKRQAAELAELGRVDGLDAT